MTKTVTKTAVRVKSRIDNTLEPSSKRNVQNNGSNIGFNLTIEEQPSMLLVVIPFIAPWNISSCSDGMKGYKLRRLFRSACLQSAWHPKHLTMRKSPDRFQTWGGGYHRMQFGVLDLRLMLQRLRLSILKIQE